MQHTVDCATWDPVPGACDCGAKTRERRSQQAAVGQLQQRCAALEAEVAALRAERKPLTDEQLLACVHSIGAPVPMGLTRERGPYEVTEPAWFLVQLVRAIERAHGIGTDAARAVGEKT